jgi:hypothetical protein
MLTSIRLKGIRKHFRNLSKYCLHIHLDSKYVQHRTSNTSDAIEKGILSSQTGMHSIQKVHEEDKRILFTSQPFNRVQFRKQAKISDENFQTNVSDIPNFDQKLLIQHRQQIEYEPNEFSDILSKTLRTPVCVTCPLTLETLQLSFESKDKVFLGLSHGLWNDPETYSQSSFILANPRQVEASTVLHRASPFAQDSTCTVRSQEEWDFDPIDHFYCNETSKNDINLTTDVCESSFSFIPIQTCNDERVEDQLQLPKLNLKPKRTYRDISDWIFD